MRIFGEIIGFLARFGAVLFLVGVGVGLYFGLRAGHSIDECLAPLAVLGDVGR